MENNRLVYMAQAFSNDLKYMYNHILGKDIDVLANYLKELWLELNDEIDDMSQDCIVNNHENVDNPSNIKSHLDFDSQWIPLDDEILDFDKITKELELRGSKYIIELQNSSLPPELCMLYLCFWKKVILINEKRSYKTV